MILNPYRMTPQKYQKVFLDTFDFLAMLRGVKGKGLLQETEIRDLANATCEQVRRDYKLSDADHDMYKSMVYIALFGKNMGRKGDTR